MSSEAQILKNNAEAVSRSEASRYRVSLLLTAASVLLTTAFTLRVVGRVDQAVLLWPVSAVGLALALPFWHLGGTKRFQLLMATLVGFLLACPVVHMPWTTAFPIGLLICLDIVIGARILSPSVQTFDDLRNQANILRFLAAIVVGPLLTGTAGGFPIAHVLHQPWLQAAQTNILAVSLGLAVATPLVLFLQSRSAFGFLKKCCSSGSAVGAALLFITVCGYVFWQNTSPFLFMVFPPLILVLLTTGLEGAIFSAVIVTAIGWTGTMHGHGPILLLHGTALDHLRVLQIFALVCVAGALPVGALLDERKRAEREVLSALEEKSRLAQELEASRHLFLSFAEHSPNVTFIKSGEGRYIYYNRKLAALFGIGESDWLGKTDHELFPSTMADIFRANDLLVMNTGDVLEVIEKVTDPAGTLRSFKSIKFAYQDARGMPMLAGVSIDVTAEVAHAEEMASMNRQLELLAVTDALTGLPNRRAFEVRARMEFATAKRTQRALSMLVLDIDDFKRRNDTFGHAAGDEALRILASVLSACARTTDLPARLGGEEFAFLLPDTDSDGALALAERLRSMLCVADQGPVPLTVSVGVTTLDEATNSWSQLLGEADDAMYEAKRTGKDKCVPYHSVCSPDEQYVATS